MKLSGHANFTRTDEFSLCKVPNPKWGEEDEPRFVELSVKLTPFGLGFRRLLAERLPDPTPPFKHVIDGRGKVQRFKDTGDPNVDGRAMAAPNPHDPAYVLELQTNQELQLIATFYEATKGDERLTFEAEVPTDETDAASWREFYKKIRLEIDASKLPMGAIVKANLRITELMGIDPGEIHKLADRFSEAAS